jgi:hypothetical protein
VRDFVSNRGVMTHVHDIAGPGPYVGRLTVGTRNDGRDELRGERVIRTVDRDRPGKYRGGTPADESRFSIRSSPSGRTRDNA